MRLSGTTALVTDAASGLGAGLVHALLARGAATVYAGARDPRAVAHQDPRVVPLHLDVTEPASVRAAAQRAGDVDLVINDAWLGGNGTLLSGDPEWARAEMETTFWGPVTVLRAFAPVLARNGGGAAVTVLPAPSWPNSPHTASGRGGGVVVHRVGAGGAVRPGHRGGRGAPRRPGDVGGARGVAGPRRRRGRRRGGAGGRAGGFLTTPAGHRAGTVVVVPSVHTTSPLRPTRRPSHSAAWVPRA